MPVDTTQLMALLNPAAKPKASDNAQTFWTVATIAGALILGLLIGFLIRAAIPATPLSVVITSLDQAVAASEVTQGRAEALMVAAYHRDSLPEGRWSRPGYTLTWSWSERQIVVKTSSGSTWTWNF